MCFEVSGEATALRYGPNESHTKQASFLHNYLFHLSQKSRLLDFGYDDGEGTQHAPQSA
jgi:hypothetical protein